jgi:hypothetical protein
MPTIGSYFSEPNGRFAVKRSYLTHLRVRQNIDNFPPSFSSGEIQWPSLSFPNIVQFAVLLPEFLPWNSNSYTLDYIITEYYYINLPDPTPIPNAGLVLRYKWDTTLNAMILEIEKESANTAQLYELESGVGGYWLDPVPGL